MKSKLVLLVVCLFCSTLLFGQSLSHRDTSKKCFISSSLFMLYNFAPTESPHFYQLNFGYRITPKDAIILEAITWRYHAPNGGVLGDTKDKYPGYVRDMGIGLAYQRFFWKGLYSTFHATPFVQQYFTSTGNKIQTGFQLFLTLRVGYHLELFKNRLFVEPSIAFTHWPINTNLPNSFEQVEKKYPNYFLFEPGLHIGFNF
ncbi:MAG: hypothetical protein R2800_08890 [Flavipsychrobacter sp.]